MAIGRCACVSVALIALLIGAALAGGVIYFVLYQHGEDAPNSTAIAREELTSLSSGFQSGLFTDEEVVFTHSAWLDGRNELLLEWRTDFDMAEEDNRESSIDLRLTGRTRGYMAVGFNAKANMAGADILIVHLDRNGGVQVVDAHSTRNGRPLVDAEQSYDVRSTAVNDTHITVHVRRLMNTCDGQDYVLDGDTVRVLWAMADTPMRDGVDGMAKHSALQRGARSIHLVYSQAFASFEEKMASVEGVSTIDLLVDTVIPSYHHTMYWCKLFHLPGRSKMHLVGYDVVIDPPENKAFVHHFVLYKCLNTEFEQWADEEAHCFASHPNDSPLLLKNGTFNPMRRCQTSLVGAWAYGSDGFVFPSDTGVPLFADDEDTTFMLEVHYDNQDYMEERVDRSGVRLYVTEELREMQSAMLTFGVHISPLDTVIPPDTKSFTGFSYCPAECSETMPEEGVEIYAGFLHSHLAGVSLIVRHIRDGVELADVLSDRHYDFNYQNLVTLPVAIDYRPGDELVLECGWDTEGKQNGGTATADEMCLVFLYAKSSWLGDRGSMVCSTRTSGMADWMTETFEEVKSAAIKVDDDPFSDLDAVVTLFDSVKGEVQMDARDFYSSRVDWSNATIVDGLRRVQTEPQLVACLLHGDKYTIVPRVMAPVITKRRTQGNNECHIAK